MMHCNYWIMPGLAWLSAGLCKFLINCLRERRWAVDLIGYGGMPSNHATIVSSMAMLVGLREGFDSAAFGVALTLAVIVILDASSLRRQIGLQANRINQLQSQLPISMQTGWIGLRERMGHTPLEILAGALLGSGLAFWLA